MEEVISQQWFELQNSGFSLGYESWVGIYVGSYATLILDIQVLGLVMGN